MGPNNSDNNRGSDDLWPYGEPVSCSDSLIAEWDEAVGRLKNPCRLFDSETIKSLCGTLRVEEAFKVTRLGPGLGYAACVYVTHLTANSRQSSRADRRKVIEQKLMAPAKRLIEALEDHLPALTPDYTAAPMFHDVEVGRLDVHRLHRELNTFVEWSEAASSVLSGRESRTANIEAMAKQELSDELGLLFLQVTGRMPTLHSRKLPVKKRAPSGKEREQALVSPFQVFVEEVCRIIREAWPDGLTVSDRNMRDTIKRLRRVNISR